VREQKNARRTLCQATRTKRDVRVKLGVGECEKHERVAESHENLKAGCEMSFVHEEGQSLESMGQSARKRELGGTE
jgi:hypothetical protein